MRSLRKEIVGMATGMVMAACLTACVSISYVDENNARRVIGFVDMEIQSGSKSSDGKTTTVTSIRAAGIHIYSNGSAGTGVVVGLSKDIYVTAPENGCVDFSVPGVCADKRVLAMSEDR